MTESLADRLALAVKNTLRDYGDSAVSLRIIDSSQTTLRFDIHQTIGWTPAITEASALKLAVITRGHKHRSGDEAYAAARNRATEAASNAVRDGTLPEAPNASHPDGVHTVWIAPQADSFAIVCDNCAGKGKFSCATCGGLGQSTCTRCGGSRSSMCTSCSGAGFTTHSDRIDGQHVGGSQTCMSCGGRGQIDCSECWGSGQGKCRSCFGKGTSGCAACNGRGELVSGILGRVDVDFRSVVVAPANAPSIAKVFEAAPAAIVENADSIQRTAEETTGLKKSVTWAADLPCAKVRYEITGKTFESTAVGNKLTCVQHQSFLDELYKEHVREVAGAARTTRQNPAELDTAIRRLMSFGLGSKAIERAVHGRNKADGGRDSAAGAATPELTRTVDESARQLLLQLSENEVGNMVQRSAAIAIPALAIFSLVGFWDGLGSLFATSPLVVALIVSLMSAGALVVFAYLKVRKRIMSLCGIAPTRLTLGWRTWALTVAIFCAAPVAQILRNAWASSPM